MSAKTLESSIMALTRAVAAPKPKRIAACTEALNEAFQTSHTFVPQISHTPECKKWLRFARQHDPLAGTASVHAIAAQALVYLRQLATVTSTAIDVLIIAALDDELESIHASSMWRLANEPFPHDRGKIDEHDIVLARCAGMGLVEAAITTTRALCHYRPRLAIMVGICGALAGRAQVGDVIVADPAFHYQYGAFDKGTLRHELKSEPLSKQLLEVAETFKRQRFDAVRAKFDNRDPRPPTPSKMIIAPMACADIVVKDLAKLDEAIVADRKTTAIDMESYSVMRSCREFGVPCIVVKAVQDLIDPKTDSYRKYAAELAASVVLNMLPHLVGTI